jgi:MYXO-CTERM domain-containing protein
MRAILLGAVAALGLCPAIASAVVTVQPERVTANPGQTVQLDVFATNPDAAENERLNAYTIELVAPTFSASGIHFVLPAANADGTISYPDSSAAHPYVFGAFAGNGPVDPAGLSDFQTVLLSAALGGTGQEANISDALNGFARVSVIVPANTPAGFYPINLDPGFLSLGSAGTSIVATPGVGGVTVTPEPGTFGLIAIGGLLALRRRRVA